MPMPMPMPIATPILAPTLIDRAIATPPTLVVRGGGAFCEVRRV
jgi:hypothetical protein